jgi:hypothetical protein
LELPLQRPKKLVTVGIIFKIGIKIDENKRIKDTETQKTETPRSRSPFMGDADHPHPAQVVSLEGEQKYLTKSSLLETAI